MRMNKADQERRLAQLRGNAYGTDHKLPQPSDPVEKPSRSIPGLPQTKKGKHVNLFDELESGLEKGKVEANPEREKELAAEKKKWEDMMTSKLINATKDHAPWYSQLDGISGVEKQKSDVERELKEKKEMKWKEDADPLKQMEKYLEKKRQMEEREERMQEKMEREMTEREQRRGRDRTPEHGMERRKRQRSRENGQRKEKRRRSHHQRSRSKSPSRNYYKHKHRRRSQSPQPNLEHLRAEQAKREAVEKERIQKLVNKGANTEERYQAVGHGGYSAQFNPQAVRR